MREGRSEGGKEGRKGRKGRRDEGRRKKLSISSGDPLRADSPAQPAAAGGTKAVGDCRPGPERGAGSPRDATSAAAARPSGSGVEAPGAVPSAPAGHPPSSVRGRPRPGGREPGLRERGRTPGGQRGARRAARPCVSGSGELGAALGPRPGPRQEQSRAPAPPLRPAPDAGPPRPRPAPRLRFLAPPSRQSGAQRGRGREAGTVRCAWPRCRPPAARVASGLPRREAGPSPRRPPPRPRRLRSRALLLPPGGSPCALRPAPAALLWDVAPGFPARFLFFFNPPTPPLSRGETRVRRYFGTEVSSSTAVVSERGQ